MINDWRKLSRFLFQRKVKDLVFFWLWELPQSLIGLFCILILKWRGKVKHIVVLENVLVVVCVKRWGAISLGQIIIGDSTIASSSGNQLFRHEFGHSMQSKKVGFLYLIIYGLPSLYSVKFKKHQHHQSLVEKNANYLAHNYFNKKYAALVWDFENYPVS